MIEAKVFKQRKYSKFNSSLIVYGFSFRFYVNQKFESLQEDKIFGNIDSKPSNGWSM